MALLEQLLSHISNHDQTRLDDNSNSQVYNYPCLEQPDLPKHKLVLDDYGNSQGKISILVDDVSLNYLDGNKTGTSIMEPYAFDYTNNIKENLVHDFTFRVLLEGESDMPLTIIKRLNNHDDKLTPDLIKMERGSAVVLEYGTNQSNVAQGLNNYLKDKYNRYENPLRARSIDNEGNPLIIHFGIIIVSYNIISTNIPNLPQELIDELCFRYRFINNVILDSKIINLNIIQQDDDDEVRAKILRMKEVLGNMKEPLYNKKFGQTLTREQFDHWIDDYELTNDEKLKLINNIMNDSKKELEKDCLDIKSYYEDITHPFSNSKKQIEKNIMISEEEIDKFEAEYESNSRIKDKKIGQMPMVIPRKTIEAFKSTLTNIKLEPKTSIMPKLNSIKNGSLEEVTMHELWKMSLKDFDNKKLSLGEVKPIYDQINDLMSEKNKILQGITKNSRNKWHRVKPELSDLSKQYLATKGIDTKRLIKPTKKGTQKSKELKTILEDKTKEEKKTLSLHNSIKDIEQFLAYRIKDLFGTSVRDDEIEFASKKGLKINTDRMDQITDENIRKAMGVHGVKKKGRMLHRIYRAYRDTNLAKWSSFVSDLSHELIVSCEQFCKTGMWVLKKMMNYDCFILIKALGKENHLFWTILMKKSDVLYYNDKGPFPGLVDLGNYYCTKIRSYRKQKFSNMLRFESLIQNAFFFWMNTYQKDIVTIENVLLEIQNGESNHDDFLSTLGTHILMALDDKQQSEEIMTNIRYILMTGFTAAPRVPKPYKMLSKIPKRVNSRFSVFLILRTIESIRRICRVERFMPNIFEVVEEEGYNVLEENSKLMGHLNMFNPWTQNPIKDFNLLIQLMYIGYEKNKQEKMEDNKIGALYKKMLVEDKKLTQKQAETIHTKLIFNGDELKTHEFSIPFVKLSVELHKKRLAKFNGDSYLRRLEEQILRELAFTNPLNVFTTSKSSSLYRHGTIPKSEDSREKYFSKRTRDKMIVVAAPLIERYPNYADLLEHSVSMLRMRPYLDVSLFDKEQHGGIREISILDIHTRIVQYAYEVIAKNLSSMCKEDTLANPRAKNDLHRQQAVTERALYKGEKFISLTSANDSTKWNQTHFVPKMSLILCHFIPPYFRNLIKTLSNCFVEKNIELDPRLINIFLNNDDLLTSDDTILDLYNQFKGRKAPDSNYTRAGNDYIVIRGGMLQGMLNYASTVVSDLLHSFTIEMSYILLRNMNNSLFEGNMSRKWNFMTMQGSDDSKVTSTNILSDLPIENKKIITIHHILHTIPLVAGKFLGIYNSIKSTPCCLYVSEYNSVFSQNNMISNATIKFSIASTFITKHPNHVMRQRELYNYIGQLLENGGSFFLAHFIQISQMRLFYRTLGISLLLIVRDYLCPKLLEFGDPSSGFFVMDNCISTGLMGWNYCLYNYTKSTNFKLGYLYKAMLSHLLGKETLKYKRVELEIFSGTLTNNLVFLDGKHRKFNEALNRMKISRSTLEKAKENFYVMFFNPTTPEEMKMKLSVKMMGGNMSRAFEFNDKITTIFRQSVYLMTNNLLLQNPDFILDNTDPEIDRQKTNAIKSVEDTMKQLEKVGKNLGSLSEQELLFLFPYMDEYNSHNKDMRNLDNRLMATKTTFKHKARTNIIVLEGSQNPINQLLSLCKKKWYNQDMRMSPRKFNTLWSSWKDRIVWLRDTAEETLEASPFLNGLQLYNFISHYDDKGRVIRINSPILSNNTYDRTTLVTLLPWSTYEIAKEASLVKEERLRRAEQRLEEKSSIHEGETVMAQRSYFSTIIRVLLHTIYMLINFPIKESVLDEVISSLLNECPDFTYNPIHSSRFKRLLYIMQKVCRKDKNGEFTNTTYQIFDEIQNLNFGFIGGYVKPQKAELVDGKFIYTGPGEWRGKISENTVIIKINSDSKNPTFIESIETDKKIPNISSFLHDLKVWADSNNISNTRSGSFLNKPIYNQKEPDKIRGRKGKSIINVLTNQLFIYKFKPSTTGVPIYINQRFDKKFDYHVDVRNIRITSKRNTINLTCYCQNEEGYKYKYNISSLTVGSDNFLQDVPALSWIKKSLRNVYIYKWVMLNNLTHEEILKMIKYYNYQDSDSYASDVAEGELTDKDLSDKYGKDLPSLKQFNSIFNINNYKSWISMITEGELRRLRLTKSESLLSTIQIDTEGPSVLLEELENGNEEDITAMIGDYMGGSFTFNPDFELDYLIKTDEDIKTHFPNKEDKFDFFVEDLTEVGDYADMAERINEEDDKERKMKNELQLDSLGSLTFIRSYGLKFDPRMNSDFFISMIKYLQNNLGRNNFSRIITTHEYLPKELEHVKVIAYLRGENLNIYKEIPEELASLKLVATNEGDEDFSFFSMV